MKMVEMSHDVCSYTCVRNLYTFLECGSLLIIGMTPEDELKYPRSD